MGTLPSTRIGIFGGTFDPPHIGHLCVARTVLESALADRVIFVPCLFHAFGKTPVSFSHRVRMCELLIDGEAGMEVSDIETKLTNPGRTHELVELLASIYPDATLRIVAGLDIYYERTRWYRFDEVEKMAPPIYVRRIGQPDVPGLETLSAPPGISSSEVRAVLERGAPTDGLLTGSVRHYIDKFKLYEVV